MTKRIRWILVSCAAVVVLPLVALIAWQMWRDRASLTFCKEARAGISFAELTSLEKRHWIGESFLGEARFKDYVDQAHSHSLEFRSQWKEGWPRGGRIDRAQSFLLSIIQTQRLAATSRSPLLQSFIPRPKT